MTRFTLFLTLALGVVITAGETTASVTDRYWLQADYINGWSSSETIMEAYELPASGNCTDGTTTLHVDISQSLTATWQTPQVIKPSGQCCEVSESQNCFEIILKLHPQADGVNFNFTTPTGSVYYTVNCGIAQPVKSNTLNICLKQGDDEFQYISFCRTGTPSYEFKVSNLMADTQVTTPAYAPVCANSPGFLLTGGSPLGGTYYINGLVNPFFDPSIWGVGEHEITYEYTDPVTMCTNSAVTALRVVPLPVLSLATQSSCKNEGWINLTGANPVGGIYSGNYISGNRFNTSAAPAGQHPITYTYVNEFGCSSQMTSTFTVNPLPVVDAGDDQVIQSGQSAALMARVEGTGVFTYHWIPSNMLVDAFIQNPSTVTLSESILFNLNVTNVETGCRSSDVVLVYVEPGSYTLAVDITGKGDVKVDGEIYTGAVEVEHGALVTLEAEANAGYVFMNWSGGLESERTTETILMTSDTVVEAAFARLGDVNYDTHVNITDVAMLVNYLLENNPAGFHLKLADANQDDQVNVADVVALVNIIRNNNNFPPSKSISSDPGFLSLENGKIFIESQGNVSALQFEFYVQGDEKVEMQVLQQGHELAWSRIGDRIRGIIYSATNAILPQGKTELVQYNSQNKFVAWGSNLASGSDASVVVIDTSAVNPLTLWDYNLIKNGLFDHADEEKHPVDWNSWVYYFNNNNPVVENGEVLLRPLTANPNISWEYQFLQKDVKPLPYIDYHFSFVARASQPRVIVVHFMEVGDGILKLYGASPSGKGGRSEWDVQLTTQPQKFNFTVTFDPLVHDFDQLNFLVSQALGTVYLDSVLLISMDDLKAAMPGSLNTLAYLGDSNGLVTGEVTQLLQAGTKGSAVVAVPSEGYRFDQWSDGLKTPQRSDYNIGLDQTFTAGFLPLKTYIVTYLAAVHGTIEGETQQLIVHGEDATAVVAKPNAGYSFTGWSDGVTNANRRDVNIVSDLTVTANFAAIIHDLVLLKNPAEGGIVTGNGSFATGQDVLIFALAVQGYRFLNWTDANNQVVSTQAGYPFTMPSQSTTLTANFALDNTSVETMVNKLEVFPNPAGSHITVKADQLITRIIMFDISGRVIYTKEVNQYESVIYFNLDAGMYIIRIHTVGGVFTRKVEVVK
jgi:hypothetical protein